MGNRSSFLFFSFHFFFTFTWCERSWQVFLVQFICEGAYNGVLVRRRRHRLHFRCRMGYQGVEQPNTPYVPPLLSKFSVVSAFCRYSQFACCSGKNNRVHTIHYTQNCHACFLLSRLKNLFNLWVGASGATFCASALYMFI